MKTSICICCYNNPEFIPQVLQAVARLTKGQYEVIVVDDASTNKEVLTILYHFQSLFMKAGIRFLIHINEKNLKHAASQNKAWDLATGDILWHIEDDMVALQEGFDLTVGKFLTDHPEVGLALPEGNGRGEWIFRETPSGNYNEYVWGLGGAFAIRRDVYEKGCVWDQNLCHQVEADHAIQVRMAGFRVAEVPGIKFFHLAEGRAHDTFRRQAQIVVGVHQFLMKWNTRFMGTWDYDNLWSMSIDDFPCVAAFRRELAAWYIAEAKKLEDKYKGLGELKDDPIQVGAVPLDIKEKHAQLMTMQLNPMKRPFKFLGHWGPYELINIIRPGGREREDELVHLTKNNHVFQGVRRIEQQLRDLAQRMNHTLSDEELKEFASQVPTKYSWEGKAHHG